MGFGNLSETHKTSSRDEVSNRLLDLTHDLLLARSVPYPTYP